jgi:hypothetical protein
MERFSGEPLRFLTGIGLGGSGEVIILNGGMESAIAKPPKIVAIVAVYAVVIVLAAFFTNKWINKRKGGP